MKVNIFLCYHEGELKYNFKSVPVFNKLFSIFCKEYSKNVLVCDLDKKQLLTKIFNLDKNCSVHWPNEDIKSLLINKVPKNENVHKPEGIKQELWDLSYEYQKKAVFDSIYNFNNKVLLCIEMGLGKSLISIMLVSYWCHNKNNCKTLFIVPSGLKENMVQELRKWSDFKEHDIQCIHTRSETITNAKIFIMSYGIASKRISELKDIGIENVVVDEVQLLKSVSSKRSKLLIPFISGMEKVILLSGSPVMNRSIETLPILQMLLPAIFNESNICYETFIKLYSNETAYSSINCEELNIIMNNIMIRLSKNDVNLGLPSHSRNITNLKTTQEGYESIETCAKEVLDPRLIPRPGDTQQIRSVKLAKFRKLFAKLLDNIKTYKIPPTLQYIEHHIRTSKTRTVIYAYNLEMIREISGMLKNLGICHKKIDGSTVIKNRQKIINNFINDNNCKVIILSISACSEGLTIIADKPDLVPIDNMIFTQISYVPSQMKQCEARISRIGSTYPVKYTYLLMNGTYEENIFERLQEKTNDISKIIDGVDDCIDIMETIDF